MLASAVLPLLLPCCFLSSCALAACPFTSLLDTSLSAVCIVCQAKELLAAELARLEQQWSTKSSAGVSMI